MISGWILASACHGAGSLRIAVSCVKIISSVSTTLKRYIPFLFMSLKFNLSIQLWEKTAAVILDCLHLFVDGVCCLLKLRS